MSSSLISTALSQSVQPLASSDQSGSKSKQQEFRRFKPKKEPPSGRVIPFPKKEAASTIAASGPISQPAAQATRPDFKGVLGSSILSLILSLKPTQDFFLLALGRKLYWLILRDQKKGRARKGSIFDELV